MWKHRVLKYLHSFVLFCIENIIFSTIQILLSMQNNFIIFYAENSTNNLIFIFNAAMEIFENFIIHSVVYKKCNLDMREIENKIKALCKS